MISPTGKNLNIVISVENNIQHNWMAYSAWYSIREKAPDANFVLLRKRGIESSYLFTWAQKFQIKQTHSMIENSGITLYSESPNIMMIRDIQSDIESQTLKIDDKLCCSAETNNCTPFVFYEKCGRFDMSTWPKKIPPFGFSLKNTEMSANEIKILEIWTKLKNSYITLCSIPC